MQQGLNNLGLYSVILEVSSTLNDSMTLQQPGCLTCLKQELDAEPGALVLFFPRRVPGTLGQKRVCAEGSEPGFEPGGLKKLPALCLHACVSPGLQEESLGKPKNVGLGGAVKEASSPSSAAMRSHVAFGKSRSFCAVLKASGGNAGGWMLAFPPDDHPEMSRSLPKKPGDLSSLTPWQLK